MIGNVEPIDPIARFREERQECSDQEILTELRALPALPDEDDPAWDDDRIWDEHAYVYLGLADLIRQRRLREGVPLLLERACYGDPGEIMRGMRHTFEAAYNPDWEALQDVCIGALGSPHPGARLWAADELAVIGDARAVPALAERLRDEHAAVRSEALKALARVSVRDATSRTPNIKALWAQLEHEQDPVEAWDIRETLNGLLQEPEV